MSNKGFFTISLDFELLWGMFDKVTIDEYGENIAGVHTVIPKLLSIFKEYDIHVTWATVGLLMFENKQKLLASLPSDTLQPTYADMRISSYEHIKKSTLGTDEKNDPYHFGASLISQILETPHQELGSHTFSHYYCIDGAHNSEEIFDADCKAFIQSIERFGTNATSIVFPRNQTTLEALEICRNNLFTSYRGTPRHFLYTGKKEKEQTNIFLRILRLLDAYVNISGHHTFNLKDTVEKTLCNVQGSRFLRPYSKRLRLLEPLRIQRIKNSMTHAAQHNQVFHLWWHPHNFGINQTENIQNLQNIIDHFKTLQVTYGMQSANMRETTKYAIESNE